MLYTIQRADVARAAATLVDAFADDPVWTRVFKDLSRKEERMRASFEVPVRLARRYGRAVASSPEFEGVAAWFPKQTADMSFVRMLLAGGLSAGMRMGAEVTRRLNPIFDLLTKDRHRHMQNRDYIYLQIVGVVQAQQGKGHAGRILRELFRESEQQSLPIYLETESESNVAMYEHYGFTVIDRVLLADVGVPMWEMVREP